MSRYTKPVRTTCFLQFSNARVIVHSLNLKNRKEWKRYAVSGKKPSNIPSRPELVYLNNGWRGFGDWLGTGTVAPHLKKFREFGEARRFARGLKLKGLMEWTQYRKSNKRPQDIPSNPHSVYKRKGWRGYGDWLGTGNIAASKKQFLSYMEAKKFVHNLNLKNVEQWKSYCRSGKRPQNIPVKPDTVYKKNKWTGYGDWLGTETVATQYRKFMIFVEARSFARSLNLKNVDEWKSYCRSGKRPQNIPAAPYKTYKNDGWMGFGDWLGIKNDIT